LHVGHQNDILRQKKDLAWCDQILPLNGLGLGLLWLNDAAPLPYVRSFNRLHLLRLIYQKARLTDGLVHIFHLVLTGGVDPITFLGPEGSFVVKSIFTFRANVFQPFDKVVTIIVSAQVQKYEYCVSDLCPHFGKPRHLIKTLVQRSLMMFIDSSKGFRVLANSFGQKITSLSARNIKYIYSNVPLHGPGCLLFRPTIISPYYYSAPLLFRPVSFRTL
jgi:hypothetical protein